MVLLSSGSAAATNQTVISSYADANLTVANDEGARFNANENITGENNTYNFFNSSSQSATQGQNALHITTSNTSTVGNVTTTNSQSGTIYLSDTGGRGWDDDGILMIAINGTIPDDFWVKITASGYQWTPVLAVPVTQYPDQNSLTYGITLNETFTKDDFIYGPQIWKPSPAADNPIFSGQDMTNSSNTFNIIFIDLWAGLIGTSTSYYNTLIDNGMIEVNYTFYNLPEGSVAVFNAYAYCQSSKQGEGVRWTNRVTDSGYIVNGANAAPSADFSANVTKGTVPLTVKFTDNSTGTGPITYAWDFGDGNTSTEQNPTHTYTTQRTYTVKLTITNIAGSSEKTMTIITSDGDIVAPTPSADLPNGSYNTNQTVNLNATDDWDTNPKIYYTLNGSTPTTSSTPYTGSISLNNEGTTTLKFIAIDATGNISDVLTRIYTIDKTQPTANASLVEGTYNTRKSVTLSANDNLDTNTTIYYTTDGSDPTTSSNRTVYTGAISISSTTLLKFAAEDSAGNWSPIYTRNYTMVDIAAPIPSADLASGSYSGDQIVRLTAVDELDSNPKIYYTTDGTNPTTSSTLYTWPKSVDTVGTTILKFIAVDAAGHISDVYTRTYIIDKPAASGTWSSTQLDINSMYNSIAVDKSGYTHIAYYEKAAAGTTDYPKLKYAYQDQNGWHIETVASTQSGSGYYVSLALDSSGKPHLAYSQSTPDILWYAYKDSAGWHFFAIANNTDVSYINLALYNDKPQISYYENTEDKIKYMYYNGTKWFTENVTSTATGGKWNSLALNSNGYPRISYYDIFNGPNQGSLRYAKRTPTGQWQIEIVDDATNVGIWSSLIIDSSGNPYISYMANEINGGALKYAYRNETKWIIETVDSLKSTGSKLVLDQSGSPRIVYQDFYTGNLKYAYKDGGNWTISNIDTVDGSGSWISLALSPSGIPNVSYMSANSGMKYAYLVPFTVNATPSGGSYNTTEAVTLKSNNGTTIYYTKDGTNPRTSSTHIKYTSPILISSTTTLKFAAEDSANNWSNIYTQTYVVTDTTAPTASVNIKSGLYNTNKAITLSMNEIGTIYYTLNGATPTTSSTKYTGPITISSTHTLKFIAVDGSGNKSPVYTQTYTIDKTAPKVALTYPKNKAAGVSRTNTLYLKFSENLKTSINWSKVYIKNLKTGKKISVSKLIKGNILYLKTSKRAAYTWYQIYIPASAVRDNAGNKLAKSYTINFRTGRY